MSTQTTQIASLNLPLPLANSATVQTPSMAASHFQARFSTFAQGLDLAPIKYKLFKEKGWTVERADAVEPQYKAFLFLIGAKVRGEFVPTFDVDEMWHAHILDTRKYMADCALHFGAYVHHYPYLGMKDEADRSRTERLFASTWTTVSTAFNIEAHELNSSNCGGGCGGGSCGGHGCGGHGCSSGHSCGGGHHGGDHGTGSGDHGSNRNDSDSSITSIISGCSGSDSSDKPRDRSQTREKKRGIISRIFGLSSNVEATDWYASVTPAFFNPDEFRPDSEALKALARKVN